MESQLKALFKFLALVVALNLIRYFFGWPFERLLIFDGLFSAMEKSSYCFNTHFTTFDWMTSFFYNFMMWLTFTWVFVKMRPELRGHDIVKSLKVYGLMLLAFASISAIYMNHYRHPKDFYGYNILDGVIVFPIVAVANGLIYPRLFAK